ncbi:UNVERIFIED_CONTAM: hypothetical protein FKN15_060849 [Acipenser sinensis]
MLHKPHFSVQVLESPAVRKQMVLAKAISLGSPGSRVFGIINSRDARQNVSENYLKKP